MFNLPFAGLGVAYTDRKDIRNAYTDYWNSTGQSSEVLRDNVGGAFSDFLGSLFKPWSDAMLNTDRSDVYRNFVENNPEIYQSIIDGDVSFDSLLSGGLDGVPNNAGKIPTYSLQPDTFQYLNAELAKFYGMDRNTAYQEALSNTAYQRAVADMQRAGLNPAAIFGAGRGSGAGGVAFIGNSNSASGFGKSNSKLFESDTYGMIAALSGLATAIVTKKPQNFWLGQQAAQGVMQSMNVIDRKFSK